MKLSQRNSIVLGVSAFILVLVGMLIIWHRPAVAPELTPGQSEVSQPVALALIEACQAEGVIKTHANVVSLTLDDGRSVTVNEADFDKLTAKAQAVQPKCGSTSIGIE
jgi:hypothetical protein